MAGTDPNEGTGSRHDDIEAIIHAAGGELPLSLRGAHSAPSRSPRPAPPDTIFSGMLGYSSLTNDEQAFLSQVVAPVIMPGVEELNRRLGKPDGESVVRGIEVSRQSGLKILLDGARNLELVWTDPQEQARTADEPDARRIYLPRGYLTFLEGDHGAGIVLNWLRGTILHPHNTPRDPFFAPRTDCYGELLRPLQQDAIRSVNELQRNGEQGVLYIDHLVAARARVIRELVTDQVGQIREQLKDGPQRKLIVVLAHANS
ncbi:MAG: hypothetical protein KDD53_07735, partial [Bdellovibrionales bacterium]|nr:hypothetical protein [Bdellovibrionales bacterium]